MKYINKLKNDIYEDEDDCIVAILSSIGVTLDWLPKKYGTREEELQEHFINLVRHFIYSNDLLDEEGDFDNGDEIDYINHKWDENYQNKVDSKLLGE